MRWLVPGCEVRIDAGCLDCAKGVRIRMRDEEILEVDPPDAVIHSNVPLAQWGEHSWSFN